MNIEITQHTKRVNSSSVEECFWFKLRVLNRMEADLLRINSWHDIVRQTTRVLLGRMTLPQETHTFVYASGCRSRNE